jgi:peptide/nickel transport system substrate-binding protein
LDRGAGKTSADFKGLFELFETRCRGRLHRGLKDHQALPAREHGTYISPWTRSSTPAPTTRASPRRRVKTGYSFANEHESGTGEYMVASRESGVKWVFKRFPD